jgi:hypothetical protein
MFPIPKPQPYRPYVFSSDELLSVFTIIDSEPIRKIEGQGEARANETVPGTGSG